jgi:hypothetical protein
MIRFTNYYTDNDKPKKIYWTRVIFPVDSSKQDGESYVLDISYETYPSSLPIRERKFWRFKDRNSADFTDISRKGILTYGT